MEVIRKISVGPDYKNAMHYQVGQDVLRGSHQIHEILRKGGAIHVWIINPSTDEIIRWKEYSSTVPVTIEFNIDFDFE